LANVGDKAQNLFHLGDDQRNELEKMALDKGKALAAAAAKAARDKLTSDAAKAVYQKAGQTAKQAASTGVQVTKQVASTVGSVFSSIGSKIAQGAKSAYERVYHDTLQKRSAKP
jgi:hypothetical protein